VRERAKSAKALISYVKVQSSWAREIVSVTNEDARGRNQIALSYAFPSLEAHSEAHSNEFASPQQRE